MIKNEYIVEKSNLLNEIRSNNMSLQEMRFFSIYLARINARKISTRRVSFPLTDFQKIMGIGRMNIKHFKTAVNGLLCKIVHLPNDKGGLSSFQLFKEVELFKDDSDTWIVEIDAHDKALPLLFNLKNNYFTYELWNALRLKSANQLRMYELLKQHEFQKKFEISINELREYLYIAPNKYLALKDFRNRVLDSCQNAFEENTDIRYTYERGKVGNRGKWLTIIFHIYKNTKHKDPMEWQEFIDSQSLPKPQSPPQPTVPTTENVPDEKPKAPERRSELQPYLSGKFEKDISPEEKNILCEMLSYKVPTESERTPQLLEKRLKLLYNIMLVSSKEPIRNAVSYLKGVIINIAPEKLPSVSVRNKKESGFNADMYDIFVNDFETIKYEI
ncbi:MAG: replication initiation protein [Ruminococcus sp.]|nr:replication initiation protein [Ruminococcus sp.]